MRSKSGLLLARIVIDLIFSTKSIWLMLNQFQHLVLLEDNYQCLMTNFTLHRSLVEALQYLIMTMPDITYVVNQVSQFMHSPTITHFLTFKRILKYLNGTLGHGLFFSANSSYQLRAFSDADWADNPDTRRSTSGSCVFLDNHLISWSSKKQPIIARSST